MIQSFRDSDTRELFERSVSRRWAGIARVALRKLQMLEAAGSINDLRLPPGNRLEQLTGDRIGQWSIRVNDQYRVCFRWEHDGAHDVELVNYH